jgi:hypothetical protein
MSLILALMFQLAAVPPGEPPARLRFVHMDSQSAVYVDDAFTRSDQTQPGTTRTRSLHVPFDTENEPFWITERHDCEGKRTQPLWRESAIEMMHDGRRAIPGMLRPWSDPAYGAGAAVGGAVCHPEQQPTPAPEPLSPDEAMNQAYQLPLEVRFQPAIYEKTGDLGETLDFLSLDQNAVGWFVEPRGAGPGNDGALVDVLMVNARSGPDEERFAWLRLRFDCRGQVLTLEGRRYAEGPRDLGAMPLEATSRPVPSGGPMALVQRYACSPDDRPEAQAVPGLGSAIAGVVAHVAAMGPMQISPP